MDAKIWTISYKQHKAVYDTEQIMQQLAYDSHGDTRISHDWRLEKGNYLKLFCYQARYINEFCLGPKPVHTSRQSFINKQ